jgi:transposase
VQNTGSRFSCNMISLVTSLGKLFFMIYGERFTAQVFIKFLRRLLRQSKGKVFLIVDAHPVHRSKVVRQWVEKHKNRLRLFRLPSYSPELNPDELVNQDVKSNAVGRKRARNVKELMENVRAFLRRKQRRPDLVRRYFLGQHVAYAAQTIQRAE